MLSEPGNELKVFLIMSKSQTMENAPVQTFIISNQSLCWQAGRDKTMSNVF